MENNRFTKKELKDKFGFYPIHTGNSGWIANEATDKLGKLEDLLEKYGIPNLEHLEKCIQDHDKYGELGEKLGCPLEVVFKALTNGVYYEDVANCMKYMVVDLHLNLDGEYVLYFDDEEYLLTKNYKKTWWLKKDKSE